MSIFKIKHQKTYTTKTAEVDPKWVLVDAEGIVLGRLASKVAKILTGKEKATYTPHIADGDFVVVINADKIKTTGKKLTDKIYHSHSGYPGGIKSIALGKLLEKDSRKVILNAVKGMLPGNRMGRKLITRCKVFTGTEHTMTAQKPVQIEL